jgi:WD40 repeat protein
MILLRLLALSLCAAMAAPAFAEAPARKDLLGDRLPEGAISRMGSGRLRAASSINCLSFTPNGKFLVSGGESNKLTFWSVATGRIEKKWTVGTAEVLGVQFSKNGKTCAVACGDDTMRILDGDTGTERRLVDPIRLYHRVNPISLSPDGKWLGLNDRYHSEMAIFDTETGGLKHRITKLNSHCPNIIFTPDSKQFVALWTDNKLHLVDLASGKSVRGLETGAVGDEVKPRSNDSPRITATALSSDGKKLFYRSYSNRYVYVVNVADGKLVKKFERGTGNYGATGNMALTPNDRFLIDSSGDAPIRVYGVASGKMLRELSAPNAGYYSAIVSPDGKLVADAYSTAIYLWDIASGKQLHAGTGHDKAVGRLAFSPDGKYLVTTGDMALRVWETVTGKELAMTRTKRNGFQANYLEMASDNKTIRWVGLEREVFRWKFDTEREPVKLTTPKSIHGPGTLVVTSPDGKLVAVILSNGRKFKLLDNIGNGPDRELAILPHESFNSVIFSRDGRTLALASSDRSVTLYDVATGSATRNLVPDLEKNTYPGNLLHFSPDGRTLLKYDGKMRIVETISGSDRVLLSPEPSGAPSSMCCSVDGRLVARGFADGLVVVTDIWAGREVLRRETGQGPVKSLALSRDGKYLATGGSDTTAIVWNLPPLARLARIASMTDESAWDDLGHRDASRAHRAMLHLIAGPDKTLRLFEDRLKPRPAVDAKRLDRLISNLDDDDSKVRERASAELLEIGSPALGALEKAARSPSLEIKRRAKDLLRRLELGVGIAPNRLRAERAIEILERIGTPAARTVLEAMLKSKTDTTR